ncbi:putative centromere protein N [Apostichopus japonicus]|uniref:Putative centromere protein N n=1 Tax=Stichopus japonicus TaxID=307972 RepID=A0A2G8LFJ9_STIJA|nr:putative centromere protein N [Apostichopus japonicus]
MSHNNLISLKKILNSLKTDQFSYIFESWDCFTITTNLVEKLNLGITLGLSSDALNRVNTSLSASAGNAATFHDTLIKEGARRKQIIDLICEACKVQGIHKKDIADLDLLRTQVHPEKKTWSVFQVVRGDHDEWTEITDPEALCEKFGAQLSLHINHDLSMRVYGRAIWLRIGFKSKTGSMRRNNAVFIVFHPHSPYLVTTPMRKKDKEAIFQALLDMLDATDIQECFLSGKNLESLQELSLDKHSQGGFSKYRLNQVDQNPLIRTRGKKRKGSVLDDSCSFTSNENLDESRRQQNMTDDVFGCNPQPKLQKLEYKMKTRLRGSSFAPSSDISKVPFRCNVQFEGVSVIDGIKELSQAVWSPCHCLILWLKYIQWPKIGFC